MDIGMYISYVVNIKNIANKFGVSESAAIVILVILSITFLCLLIFILIYHLRIRYNYRSNSRMSRLSNLSYDYEDDDKEANPLLTNITDAIKKINEIFGNGKVLVLHTAKGQKVVTMFLLGTELRWESIIAHGTKKYKLDLKEILFVELGKKTKNFANCNADGCCCVSLVSNLGTLDIEVNDESERDRIANVFMEFVSVNKRIGRN